MVTLVVDGGTKSDMVDLVVEHIVSQLRKIPPNSQQKNNLNVIAHGHMFSGISWMFRNREDVSVNSTLPNSSNHNFLNPNLDAGLATLQQLEEPLYTKSPCGYGSRWWFSFSGSLSTWGQSKKTSLWSCQSQGKNRREETRSLRLHFFRGALGWYAIWKLEKAFWLSEARILVYFLGVYGTGEFIWSSNDSPPDQWNNRRAWGRFLWNDALDMFNGQDKYVCDMCNRVSPSLNPSVYSF